MLPLRLARIFLGKNGPRIIMDTRDLDDPVPGSWRSRARIVFHRLVFWLADFLADGQTAITKRMVELVRIPDDELLGIWPSGVTPEQFWPASSNRKWPGSGESIHLMYIGILLERRNPAALCRAVAKANAQGMQFDLSLVGNGPAQSQLEPFVESGNGTIRLCEPVPHDQIPDLLATAHVGVTSLPDPDDVKYQASSPIKLFEYMAAGLPALATSSACHTEVVGDGRFAYWAENASEVELYETLATIWEDRAALSQRGAEAQSAVHNWTWEAAAEKLHHALLSGLARSTGDKGTATVV
jgi:glycosyltransferase involved in cell wall biosynthesis